MFGSIKENGTILHLVPEGFDINNKNGYVTERSWIIVGITGKGGSSVCYEAICGNKTGRLKEFQMQDFDEDMYSTQREEYLSAYREIDRIRRENPESRRINNYISAFELLYNIDFDLGKIMGSYIWMPDAREGILFERYLSTVTKESSKMFNRYLYRMLTIMLSLTECVKEFHSAGLFNLDLKPSNFLVYFPWEENLDSCQIFLFDLDTVRVCTDKAQKFKVTDGYSAPELYMGRGDNRSDIYSIGALMKTAIELINKSESEKNPMIAAIIQKTLSQNPNKRYDNCEGLLEDIKVARRFYLKS